MRKIVIRTVALMLALSAGIAFAAEKPNIVLILVDDVGYCDVGAFASRLRNVPVDKLYYETPRMDELAK